MKTLNSLAKLSNAAILLAASLIYLSGCASTPTPNGGRDKETRHLDKWVDTELTPYLKKELVENPKFNKQPVLIVAMNNGEVLPQIDELRTHIRTRVNDALISTAEINLINRAPRRAQAHHRSLSQLECGDTQQIRYYVGIDVQQSSLSSLMNVSVRAVDGMYSNAWVSGFGLNKEMEMSSRQINAAKKARTDEYLRGLRVLPFNSNEPDLLASYMAHNISCLIRDKAMKEFRLSMTREGKSTPSTDTTVNLIGSYLTRFNEVSVAGKKENANTFLKMKLHPVDLANGMYLMSADVERIIDGKRIGGLATQSYIYINPNQLRDNDYTDAMTATPTMSQPGFASSGSGINIQRPTQTNGQDIIKELSIVTPNNMNDCSSFRPFRNGTKKTAAKATLKSGNCFAINLQTRWAAKVYLLHEGADGKVHRLQPTECGILKGTPAAIEAGQTLRFPAELSQAKVINLDNNVGTENIYAVAITDQNVTHRFEGVFNAFPDICGDGAKAITVSASGAISASQTLAKLEQFKKQNAGGFDWKQFTINHVK